MGWEKKVWGKKKKKERKENFMEKYLSGIFRYFWRCAFALYVLFGLGGKSKTVQHRHLAPVKQTQTLPIPAKKTKTTGYHREPKRWLMILI